MGHEGPLSAPHDLYGMIYVPGPKLPVEPGAATV